LKELLKSLIFSHALVTLQRAATARRRMRPPMLINSRVLLLVFVLVLVLRITIMCQGVFSSDQTITFMLLLVYIVNDFKYLICVLLIVWTLCYMQRVRINAWNCIRLSPRRIRAELAKSACRIRETLAQNIKKLRA